jgi:hypothetical protein
MAERALRVGLVGFGTIGTGLVRAFQSHGLLVNERLGFPLELARIADIDLERDRGVPVKAYKLSRDWRELVDDPSIDLVVELVGGTRVAKDVVSPRSTRASTSSPRTRRCSPRTARRSTRSRRPRAPRSPSRRASAAPSRCCARCARGCAPTESCRCTGS